MLHSSNMPRGALSSREISSHQTNAKIAVLDHAAQDLPHQFSHVLPGRRQNVAQLTQLFYDNSPISRLPNELLAFIFEAARSYALYLSHVNRRWRCVALQSPSLWRNIHLPNQSFDEIVEYLNRSHPLSLIITIDVDDGDFFNRQAFAMIVKHVSRWHSFDIYSTNQDALDGISADLRDLSAPRLTRLSIKLLHYEDGRIDNHKWCIPMFKGGAPLHTVHIRGFTISRALLPTAAIVDLKLDIRDISTRCMDYGILASMPNLRILTLQGSILWFHPINRGHPVILPLLEQLTCGSASIRSLFLSTIMPNLRYLRLVSDSKDNWDVYDPGGDNAQAFLDAIAKCPHSPAFPNVEELHYDICANYAADCIFVALPRVSLVRFSPLLGQDNWRFCNAFFKALIDDPLRWPYLGTIMFNRLSDQVFESLRDFLIARSSEERLFTIHITTEPSCDKVQWLREHVNLELATGPGVCLNRMCWYAS